MSDKTIAVCDRDGCGVSSDDIYAEEGWMRVAMAHVLVTHGRGDGGAARTAFRNVEPGGVRDFCSPACLLQWMADAPRSGGAS